MIKTTAYTNSLKQVNESMYNANDMEIASSTDVYKSPVMAPEEYNFSESFKAGKTSKVRRRFKRHGYS